MHIHHAPLVQRLCVLAKHASLALFILIVDRMVRIAGGTVKVASDGAGGHHFEFGVDLKIPAPPKAWSDQGTAVAPSALHAPLKVLLVEDHTVNQLLATTLLKKWGHTVAVADNGQIALDLFPSQHWDVVLMDIHMPVMDGVETAKAIRRMQTGAKRTPIIALTAGDVPNMREDCRQAGIDHFITKPYRAENLKAVIEDVCGV